MTVYLDILFLLNFLMDSIILSLSCFLLRHIYPLWKIAIYAAGMAIYGCGMFFSDLAWLYFWPFRIIMTLLFIWLIFRSRSVFQYLKELAVFFMVSFLLVGSIYALASLSSYQTQMKILMKGDMVYIEIKAVVLLLGIFCTYFLVWIMKKLYLHNFSKDQICITLSLTLDQQTESFLVLLDTGCTAVEPFTGRPLVVLGNDAKNFLSKCSLDLPYTYAGGVSMMRGFYPQKAEIKDHNYVLCEKICVGIGKADFSGLPYQGIINPDAVCAIENQNVGKGERKIEKKQLLS